MTGRTGSAGNVGSVDINDNCGPISLSSDAQGLINFGTSGGTDCTTPGYGGLGNTHSARTQYYNVAWIKIKAYTYLTTNTWLQGLLTDNVNLNQTCNAYWDGTSVNFFRSGGGCGNTGELPGVSLHEWGHGMDDNDGSGGNSPPVETRADWTAILQTHQSCAGGGFFVTYNPGCGQVPPPGTGYNCGGYGDCCLNCSGIRDADWAQHSSNTPWTAANHGSVWNCGGGWYNGPCNWEDHCESGIATQALWDLAIRDLPTYCGMDTTSAWQLIDRLWYSSMPQMGNMYTCTPPNSSGCTGNTLYNLFRAIDDDGDGTANGTPHAQGIYRALARHNIACGNASDPANQNQTSCPSLATPTLSGTAGSNSVNLSWNSIANATRYFIYRNDTSCDSGFTKIATVTAPTTNYTDNTATNGITSYYRIQAATSNDSCVSAMSNCVAVTPQPCAGSVTLNKSIYNCSDTGTITVLDSTAPSSPFTVEIWSTTDPTHRTVTMTGSPSTYTGTFTTTTGTPGANQVKVSHGDTIYVMYVDPDYCGTPNVNVDTTSSVDCQCPVISNVQATNVMGTTADIIWTTDELSNSSVTYGTTIPPSGNTSSNPSMVTSHTVSLSGLTECTNYYYYVSSTDSAGNGCSNNNNGNYYTFTTGVNVVPTYNSTDVPKTINDNSTVTSTITVTDNKIIQDVNVTIGNITHTWDADLDIYLIAPDNTRVELSTGNGGSGDNYINTVFDDEAAVSITEGTAPFTGSFKPEGSLSVLDGKNAQGVWALEVTDHATGDTGTLNSWSITFTYPAQSCGPSLEYQTSTFTDTCSGTGSGNNNGVIDAGEDITLQITLHNNGTSGTTGVSATISTTTPGITITDNYATFPNIPADGTGTSEANHFSFKVGTSVTCGTTINFSIHITSNEGSWDDTFSLTVGTILPGSGTALNENFSGGIPSTWTIIDGGSGGGSAATWTTANPCSRTATYPIVTPFAIVDSDCAGSSATQDEQLITPLLNLSSATSVTLEFDQYFYWYGGGQNEIGDVDVKSSKTGGNWTNVFKNQGASSPNPDHRTIDITSQAAGASDVQIRFHYYQASYEWYWMIDNVKVTYTTPGGCNMNSCTPNAPNIIYSSYGTPVEITGNGDSWYDRGEKWSVQVTLTNNGTVDATNVTATLSGNGITVCTPNQTFGNIPVSGTGSATFEFVIDSNFSPCGGSIGFDITNKTCDQITPAGPNENDVFNLTVGKLTAGGTITLFGPDDLGTLNNWTLSNYQAAASSTCHTAADAQSNLNGTSYMTKTTPISTVGYTNITVYYDWRVTNAAATQYLDWSTNGTTWNLGVASINTTTWLCNQSTVLPAGAEGQATLYIRFRTVSNNATRRGEVDYISITGNSPPSYDCSYVGSGSCGNVTPPAEVATGTNYTWTGQVMGWNSDPSATGYRVYRGVMANLPSLCNATQDFCIRYDGTNTSLDVSSDNPAVIDPANRVVFYIITAYNGAGEGPAGNATCGGRQVNTTENCP
jgi:subtilisin-like proprotein convertase family protein